MSFAARLLRGAMWLLGEAYGIGEDRIRLASPPDNRVTGQAFGREPVVGRCPRGGMALSSGPAPMAQSMFANLDKIAIGTDRYDNY